MKKKILLCGCTSLLLLVVFFSLYHFRNYNLQSESISEFEVSPSIGHETWVFIYTDSGVDKDYLKEFIGYKYNPTFYSEENVDKSQEIYNDLNVPKDAIKLFVFLVDDYEFCRYKSLESELQEKSKENELIYYVGVTDPKCLN